MESTGLKCMIAWIVLFIAGCSSQTADQILADMENDSPGEILGEDNACNSRKMEIVNQYGVDYRYENQQQTKSVVTSVNEHGGVISTMVQNTADGRIEFFHYFSRSFAFDSRTEQCSSWEVNQ